MLILPNWTKHQRAGIANVLRTRISRLKKTAKARGEATADLLAPYSMTYVCVVTFFGRDFVSFSSLVGAQADGLLLRVLQWTGQHSAFVGEVDVKASEFGPVVLTNRHARVGEAEGEKTYRALIKSGIAVKSTPGLRHSAELAALKLVGMTSRLVSCNATGTMSCSDGSGHRVAAIGDRRSESSPQPPDPGGDGGGGSASPTERNGTANGNGHRPPVPPVEEVPPLPDVVGDRMLKPERAAVIAACWAIIKTKDVDQKLREQAKAVRADVESGYPPVDKVRDWVNREVWARTAARVAYATARRDTRGD